MVVVSLSKAFITLTQSLGTSLAVLETVWFRFHSISFQKSWCIETNGLGLEIQSGLES